MKEIKENKTFKVYKYGGKPILVLNLSFPMLYGEEEKHARFNLFYKRLEDECIAAAEELANTFDGRENQSGLYLLLDVSYIAEESEKNIKITRKYELRRGRKTLSSNTVTDFFTSDLFFAKSPKNIKKQRFIPSRNAKNIT